jgi:hypothetical protein
MVGDKMEVASTQPVEQRQMIAFSIANRSTENNTSNQGSKGGAALDRTTGARCSR